MRAQRTRTLRSLIGLLCIALVLLAGGVSLLHSHPVGTASDLPSDPACSLCSLTHVAAMPGAVVLVPVAVESVVLIPPVVQTHVPARFFSFSLYVRPPPAEAAHS